LIGSLALFGILALVGLFKRPKTEKPSLVQGNQVQELLLQKQANKAPAVAPPSPKVVAQAPVTLPETRLTKRMEDTNEIKAEGQTEKAKEILPEANRVEELFLIGTKNPVVETLSYTSRVPWIKGRPAWLADYATYYQTTRHFIARSLNRTLDYFSQKIGPGDRFNVFKKDRNVEFHLLIDLSRIKMWFYLLDKDRGERLLLKTYNVGLGRKDAQKASGFLTPTGKYLLGSKVAIYKPEVMGYFQDRKVEMVRVFGTRWIPFEKELENCSENAKGYGLHGTPWIEEESTGQVVEDRAQIGKYTSDGCIRLFHEDIEEIFSIVITKPTTVEIVKDFYEAKLPGKEVQQLSP
jgi:hypothetical protein